MGSEVNCARSDGSLIFLQCNGVNNTGEWPLGSGIKIFLAENLVALGDLVALENLVALDD